MSTTEPICGAEHEDVEGWWTCTRAPGHGGEHIAEDDFETPPVLCARWPGTTAPAAQTPEPTDEQRAVAMDVVRDITGETHLTVGGYWRSVDRVARAIAAAVTAEREKYEALADELEQPFYGFTTHRPIVDCTRKQAATRIREVTR